MEYSINKQEKYAVFSLKEDNLNSVVAPSLKSEFVILANEGVENLIFDMAEIKFVDSSGLSAILTADRLWKKLGSFILTGVKHPSVKKLIEISRLNSILTIIPTVEESIEFVFMESLERELKAETDKEQE